MSFELETSSTTRATPAARSLHPRAFFDESSRDEEHFPSTIDPRIYHVQLIREHLGDLRGKRVLDVGCGKGRFARVFQERSAARTLGPRYLPKRCCDRARRIHTRAGSMTELPFEDGFFDGAYATESLEHAVEIRPR